MDTLHEHFFALLRLALGVSGEGFSCFEVGSVEEWPLLYRMATQQSLLGVVYRGVCKLPKDRQPPFDVVFQWASEAETVRGQNKLINREAERLTRLFEAEGRKCAILKGPANARLYPDPFMRQCGDIDIWVEGGRESVDALLRRMGLLPESGEDDDVATRVNNFASSHHLHLPRTADGISVEVHYRPSSGNRNPFSTARLMRFLDDEIAHPEPVPEGFNVPSMKFALAMQLSHIQRHFIAGGIGMRQIMDYYVLLSQATEADRAEISVKLRKFGLYRTAGALMWLLGQAFGLDRSKMLCRPDPWRGAWMLDVVMKGGNFGRYAGKRSRGTVMRWLVNRKNSLRMFPFDAAETFWSEVGYWKLFLRTVPLRIKLRKLSIKEFF
ncbi:MULTISPECIES: nucleotidyltransferase family protein [unclassified Fibrobacter]|uniref:nucleotidyltransferase domain-containing protein n=1 Tax=unclassified Fibrobacter TaxID=2634177 RepID=UPI0032E4573A